MCPSYVCIRGPLWQVRDKRTGQCHQAPCGRTIADTGMWDLVRAGYWVKNWCCKDCAPTFHGDVPDNGARLLTLWALVEGDQLGISSCTCMAVCSATLCLQALVLW